MCVLDLHIHTTRYSDDSQLSPEVLVEQARRVGLQGVCLSEHEAAWRIDEFRAFSQQCDLLLVRAREVPTEMGHIIAIGLEEYPRGTFGARELRRMLDKVGGVGILAHPFRFLLDPSASQLPALYQDGRSLPTDVEEAARHPIFRLVDAVEVLNGGTPAVENWFALEVAGLLGLKMVGGTDAHTREEVGLCVTVFEDRIASQDDLVEALRTGSFYPAQGPPSERLLRFDGAAPGPFGEAN